MNDTAEIEWKPLPWDTKYLRTSIKGIGNHYKGYKWTLA